jgi:hypothetical protein
MNMKCVEEVGNNVTRKSVFHLENFHASSAYPSDRSSGEIMTL